MRCRVAALQYEMRPLGSFEEFARTCRALLESAAGYGAQFAVFPEMLTCQLLALHPDAKPQEAPRILHQYTERYLAFFRAEALRLKMHIIGGSHFTTEADGAVRNVSYFFHPDGRHETQPKIHVTPSERATWGIAPGHAVNVFDTTFGKVATQVCYDVEFPELARLQVERGARLIFVPFCTDDRRGFLRVRYCAQARCIENQIYVVTAGVVGNLRGVVDMDVHYARSAVLTPSDHGFARDGVAGEASANVEAVLVEEIDLALLEQARTHGTVKNWNDRRIDLYEVKLKTT